MGNSGVFPANIFACSLRKRMLQSTACAAGEPRACFIPTPAMHSVVYIPKKMEQKAQFCSLCTHTSSLLPGASRRLWGTHGKVLKTPSFSAASGFTLRDRRKQSQGWFGLEGGWRISSFQPQIGVRDMGWFKQQKWKYGAVSMAKGLKGLCRLQGW